MYEQILIDAKVKVGGQKNRADWKTSTKEANVRIGLYCHQRRRRRGDGSGSGSGGGGGGGSGGERAARSGKQAGSKKQQQQEDTRVVNRVAKQKLCSFGNLKTIKPGFYLMI